MAKDAEKFGYFQERDTESLYCIREGKREEFRLLREFEFTSDRKAMSTVVQEITTGKIYAFVKGADSIIEKMLVEGQKPLKNIQEDVEELSEKGLRTLMFAMREIEPELLGERNW